MDLNFHFRLKAKEVVYITIFWIIIAIIGVAYDFFTVYSTVYEVGIENYNPMLTLKVTVITVAIAGITGGGTYVFFLKNRFRKFPFLVSTFLISMVLITIIVSLGIFASFVYNSLTLSVPIYSAEVFQDVEEYLKSTLLWQNTIMWFIFTAATIFVLQVKDRYGPGMLFRSIIGRYHQPIEEVRVFMFLDIKSSTAIAEKLGHIKYFKLLNDFFADITEPVLITKGEVYQYVGDEVVITWTIKNGTRQANCIQCFFAMKKRIAKRAKYYEKTYGLVPRFKAGMHCGPVTAGEIGIIKRDVIYTGDVLNTASRIQEACNQFGVDLLISDKLQNSLKLPKKFCSKEIGGIILRGKQQKVGLYSIGKTVLSNQNDMKVVLKMNDANALT